MKSEDITGGLDLLGDWLDARGYTEEAGLCTRAMDEINRLYEWKDKAGDIDRVKTVELVDMRAENARLQEALKPFKEAAEELEDWENGSMSIWERSAAMNITCDDLRKCQRILDGSTVE